MDPYQPGDAVVIGFDDAVAADNAIAGQQQQQYLFTLPDQSSSSEEEESDAEEEEEDHRRVVGPANDLAQFERGTQQEARAPPPLTQRTKNAVGALLGINVADAPPAPVAVIEQDEELHRQAEAIFNAAPDISQQKGETGQKLTDSETKCFSTAIIQRRPVFSITTTTDQDQNQNVSISHKRSEAASASSATAVYRSISFLRL